MAQLHHKITKMKVKTEKIKIKSNLKILINIIKVYKYTILMLEGNIL